MQSKLMSNSEQLIGADDSIAKISGNTVEIFGQTFPLIRPHYHPTGELESFAIELTVITYQGHTIPIDGRIYLYKDGKFHGTGLHNKNYNDSYKYEHRGQEFPLSRGIFFYHSGKLERFSVKDEIKINLTDAGEQLMLYKGDTVTFYEDNGLPKRIWLNRVRSSQGEYFNVIEISETGKITKILEDRVEYDYN
ncbi:hypothetical protein NO2_0301 [Candidatus Termititenax persephonae]|uniref:Uncharacterized protein n=1 Tax=Candidatus Termititenax persephonae TaxID=2218525 RepID=A0A388TG82_9BACT|nr:hypothetical protein NO2_0301 [Candidatus Termititenax persephonae]